MSLKCGDRKNYTGRSTKGSRGHRGDWGEVTIAEEIQGYPTQGNCLIELYKNTISLRDTNQMGRGDYGVTGRNGLESLLN